MPVEVPSSSTAAPPEFSHLFKQLCAQSWGCHHHSVMSRDCELWLCPNKDSALPKLQTQGVPWILEQTHTGIPPPYSAHGWEQKHHPRAQCIIPCMQCVCGCSSSPSSHPTHTDGPRGRQQKTLLQKVPKPHVHAHRF